MRPVITLPSYTLPSHSELTMVNILSLILTLASLALSAYAFVIARRVRRDVGGK